MKPPKNQSFPPQFVNPQRHAAEAVGHDQHSSYEPSHLWSSSLQNQDTQTSPQLQLQSQYYADYVHKDLRVKHQPKSCLGPHHRGNGYIKQIIWII